MEQKRTAQLEVFPNTSRKRKDVVFQMLWMNKGSRAAKGEFGLDVMPMLQR